MTSTSQYSDAEVQAASMLMMLASSPQQQSAGSKGPAAWSASSSSPQPLFKKALRWAEAEDGDGDEDERTAPTNSKTKTKKTRSQRASVLGHAHAPTLSDEDSDNDDSDAFLVNTRGSETVLGAAGQELMRSLRARVRSNSPSSRPITCGRCRIGDAHDDWLVEFCSPCCHHEFMDREQELLFNSMNPAMQYPSTKVYELNGFPVATKNDMQRVAPPVYPLKLYMPTYRPGHVLVCKAGSCGDELTVCYAHMVLLDGHCRPLYIVSPLIARKAFKAMLGITDEGSDVDAEEAKPSLRGRDLGLTTKRAKRAIAAARAGTHLADDDSASDMEVDHDADDADDADDAISVGSHQTDHHKQQRKQGAASSASFSSTKSSPKKSKQTSPRTAPRSPPQKRKDAAASSSTTGSALAQSAREQLQHQQQFHQQNQQQLQHHLLQQHYQQQQQQQQQQQHNPAVASAAPATSTAGGMQFMPYTLGSLYQQAYLRHWATHMQPSQQHPQQQHPQQQQQQQQFAMSPSSSVPSTTAPYGGAFPPASGAPMMMHPMHYSQHPAVFPPAATFPATTTAPATTATATAGGEGEGEVGDGEETETDDAVSNGPDADLNGDHHHHHHHHQQHQQQRRRRRRGPPRAHYTAEGVVEMEVGSDEAEQGQGHEAMQDDAATETTMDEEENEDGASSVDVESADTQRKLTTNAEKWVPYYSSLGIRVPRLKWREGPVDPATGKPTNIYYLADKPQAGKAGAKRPKVDNSMTADAFMNRFRKPGTNEYDLEAMYAAYERACPIDLVVQGHKYIVCPCGEVFANGQAVGGHKGACKTPRLRDRDERTVAAFLNEHYPGYKKHLAFAKETQKLVAECKKRWPKVRGAGARSRRKPKAASAAGSRSPAIARRNDPSAAADEIHPGGRRATASAKRSHPHDDDDDAAILRSSRHHHHRKQQEQEQREAAASRLGGVAHQDYVDAVKAAAQQGPDAFWRYFRIGRNEPQPQPESIVLAGFQLHEETKARGVSSETLRTIYEGRFGMCRERRHFARHVHYRPHTVLGFDKARSTAEE